MARINQETTSALVSVEVPDEAEIETPVHDDFDEEQMTFKHAEASAAARAPQGGQEDNMIYHGAQQQPANQSAPKIETIKRDGDKIGRNDPCPCGSGKKYKKCHGLAGSMSEDSHP